MTEDKTFTTQDQGPFAVLKVPDDVLAELVENPSRIEELKAVVGVRVLVLSHDTDLFTDKRAVEEVERFLGVKPKPWANLGTAAEDIQKGQPVALGTDGLVYQFKGVANGEEDRRGEDVEG